MHQFPGWRSLLWCRVPDVYSSLSGCRWSRTCCCSESCWHNFIELTKVPSLVYCSCSFLSLAVSRKQCSVPCLELFAAVCFWCFHYVWSVDVSGSVLNHWIIVLSAFIWLLACSSMLFASRWRSYRLLTVRSVFLHWHSCLHLPSCWLVAVCCACAVCFARHNYCNCRPAGCCRRAGWFCFGWFNQSLLVAWAAAVVTG